MEPPQTAFQYEPLNDGEFRLLDLLPGKVGEPIYCRLRHALLGPKPLYECLSYTWGSEEFPRLIHLNDTEASVTRSVFGALETLRDAQVVRTLWIDQVCINQQDLEERSSQVQKMHMIYRSARATAVYLHTEDDLVLPSFDPSMRLLMEIHAARGLPRSLRANIAPAERALEMIASHPWFSRVWIIQEVMMSRRADVYYRGGRTEWETLQYLFMVTEIHQAGRQPALRAVDRIRHMVSYELRKYLPGDARAAVTALRRLENRFRRVPLSMNPILRAGYTAATGRDKADLIEILGSTTSFQSKDPRDRVFALLNIAFLTEKAPLFPIPWRTDPDLDRLNHGILVDYQQPVDSVYLATAQYIIRNDRNLRLLCFSGGSSNADLPSWVPDWASQRLFPMDKVPHPFHRHRVFKANASRRTLRQHLNRGGKSGPDASEIRIDLVGRQLHLHGSVLDTIDLVGPAFLGETIDDVHTAVLTAWRTLFTGGRGDLGPKHRQWPYPTTRAGTLHRFWEDLVVSRRLKATDGGGDGDGDGNAGCGTTDHPMADTHFKGPYAAWGGRFTPPYVRNHIALFDWLVSSLPFASLGRRAATTSTGFLALVPPGTRQGDRVGFFEGGGCIPFVVRRNGAAYSFVGACYVHGFMNVGKPWRGEASEEFIIE